MAALLLLSLVLFTYFFSISPLHRSSHRAGSNFYIPVNQVITLHHHFSSIQRILHYSYLEEQQLSTGSAGYADEGSEPELSLNYVSRDSDLRSLRFICGVSDLLPIRSMNCCYST